MLPPRPPAGRPFTAVAEPPLVSDASARGASLAMVVLINLVPIVGVLLLDWSVWTVMLLFWIENALLGAVTVLRILLCMPDMRMVWLGKLFVVPFFIVHYGFFCAGHLVFLLVMFGPEGAWSSVGPPWENVPLIWHSISGERGLLLATAVLAAGLLVRMLFEFVLSGQYRDANPQEEMMKPYGRIVVLHITIIISGVLVMGLGLPIVAVLVLVGLKLAVELGYWKVGDITRSDGDEDGAGRSAARPLG